MRPRIEPRGTPALMRLRVDTDPFSATNNFFVGEVVVDNFNDWFRCVDFLKFEDKGFVLYRIESFLDVEKNQLYALVHVEL